MKIDRKNILESYSCTINNSPAIEKVSNMFLVKKPMILSSILFGMIHKFPSMVDLKQYEWNCIAELGLKATEDYEIRYYTYCQFGSISEYDCVRDTMFSIDAARKICELEKKKSDNDTFRHMIDEIICTLDDVEIEYESMVAIMANSHKKEARRNGKS